LAALAFLCLAPTYIAQETVDFGAWEGGLAALALATHLHLTVRRDLKSPWFAVILLSATSALAFFINPALGLGALASFTLYCTSRIPLRKLPLVAGLSAVMIAALFTPWVVRNSIVMGEPIFLRSNAGLELALANHPAAIQPQDEREQFLSRLKQIHPAQSLTAYGEMKRAGGEVAYSQALGREWMKENPRQVFGLLARHIRQFFLPEPWQFGIFGSGRFTELRSLLASSVGGLGICAVLFNLLARRPGWSHVTLLVVIPALAVAPFQPVPRYTYLVYGVLTYAAFDIVIRFALYLRSKSPVFR
jgi:hypothetical protein